jgi:putative transposase
VPSIRFGAIAGCGRYLRYVDGLVVNQKRIYAVMKAADLRVKSNPKLRAKRKADTKKPKPTRPNEWWGIDMTKVMIEGFGWVYRVVVLDWHTKKVVGPYAGLQARARHWLVALHRAVNRQFQHGVRDQGLRLMADNGCQPASLAFMRAGAAMGIHQARRSATATEVVAGSQARTSYSNPKGNADTERFLRTLKEELVWRREWTARPPSSKPSTAGSPALTPAISIRRSATERRMRSRPSSSATPLP